MDACQLLPKEWIHGTTCPVCGGISLTIQRIFAGPDQFRCNVCASSFEISTDGLHVRLVSAPESIAEQTCERWLAPAVIRQITFERIASNQMRAGSTAAAAYGLDELRKKAVQMQKLGNSIQSIADTLQRSFGASAEQIQVICAELNISLEYQQRSNLNALVFSFVCLLVIGSVLVLFF